MSRSAVPRIAVCFLLAPLCARQEPQLQLRVDARLVTVPVSVVNDRGRTLGGLHAGNFRIFDDGVEQPITHFDVEDSPIALGLVIDTSASMQRMAPVAARALTMVLERAAPADEYFLVEFGESARLVVPLTRDTAEISAGIGQSAPERRTALFDAILLSLKEIRRAESPRRALLVVTDGMDNGSALTTAQIDRIVRESDVPIYTLAVVKRDLRTPDLMAIEWLRLTAQQSGGRKYESRPSDLKEFAEQIGRDLRAHYVLGFRSGDDRRDGRYHQLRVEVIPPAGVSKARASWRQVYLAPGM
jgi:Ca-activated chloride channel homolog